MGGWARRPIAPAEEASGEDENVVGEIRDRVGRGAQIVERVRGPERSDDPALLLGNQAERRDMYLALFAERGDDTFADHRHDGLTLAPHEASRFFLAISVWPGALSAVASSTGLSAATPQSSGSSWA